MVKTKCICENFEIDSTSLIEEFINSCYEKYNEINIKHTIYTVNEKAYMNVLVTYSYDTVDMDVKTILKGIIKLDNISINMVTTKFNVGFNHASILINYLESLNIISSREDGRKVLMDYEEACKIIDSLGTIITVVDKTNK